MTHPELDRHDTDILILGSGGAGLFAALHAQQSAPEGTRITIAVKGLVGKSGCTRMVQGGYNVALGGGDTVERHFMDTINGGKWLPDQDMVAPLRTSGGAYPHWRTSLAAFSRNSDGTLRKGLCRPNRRPDRHKGDLTGIEIINRLMEQVLSRPIERLQEHRAIGLIPTRDGAALAGVLMINMRNGRFCLVRAKTVLMATGGGPSMYKYHTPSGDKSMDGLAMALRVGLPLRDMEMVQFHPTGLLAGPHTRMTGTVLEEGLRGAGGQLLNHAGQRFMFDYDAKGERATRDVVSRAIYAEMRKTNDPEREGVFISMAHLGPEWVAQKFKGMVKRCADCGFDLAGGTVEVVPTAHYFMGGVVVDVDTVPPWKGSMWPARMQAVPTGQTALAAAVSRTQRYSAASQGTQWAQISARWAPSGARHGDPGRRVGPRLSPFSRPVAPIHPVRTALREVMWEGVGVMRTQQGMQTALSQLDELCQQSMELGMAGDARL